MKVTLEVLDRHHLNTLFMAKNDASVLKDIPGNYPLNREAFIEKKIKIIDAGPSVQQASFTILVNEEVAGITGHFRRDKKSPLEVGYFLATKWWGKGVATKALQLNLLEMKKLGVNGQINASHAADNLASGRVLEKAGFRCVGEVAFTMPDGSVVMDPQWTITL